MRKKALKKFSPRHKILKQLRETGYPVEVITEAGNTIYLNPIKRTFLKGGYINKEFQREALRMLKHKGVEEND